jgi:hypothetical protein
MIKETDTPNITSVHSFKMKIKLALKQYIFPHITSDNYVPLSEAKHVTGPVYLP